MDQFRHGLVTVAFASLLILAGSCQALFPQPLSIIDAGPLAGRYGSTLGLSVWVEFSADVPQGKAEKSILLKENGTTLGVRYTWSDRRVTVLPDKGFALGNRYDLSVASTVEDSEGNDLGTDFVRTFYTRLDDARPVVTVTSPAYGAITVDPFQPVTLTFSKAVDRASFYNNLLLSPSYKVAYSWGAGDLSCTVTPLESLKSPSVYTVKVGAGTLDTEGNSLGAAVSTWFAEGTVGPGPGVSEVQTISRDQVTGQWAPSSPQTTLAPVVPAGTVVYTSGVEKSWGLEIEFDVPVVRSGLESLVSVEPAWAFTIPQGSTTVQRVTLIPDAPLVFGTEYTLTLHKGIADSAGNPSTVERVYRFRADGPSSAPPVLQSIAFHTNAASPDTNLILGDHSTDYQALTVAQFSNVASLTFVDLTFQVAAGADIDSASVMGHFSISATDASTSAAITAIGLPSPLGARTQTIRVSFQFTRGGSGLLIFKLASGFSDSQGNATTADQSWPVLE